MNSKHFLFALLSVAMLLTSCGDGNDTDLDQPANEFTSGSIASPDSATLPAIQDLPNDTVRVGKVKNSDTTKPIQKKSSN